MSNKIECPECLHKITPTGDEQDGDEVTCPQCGLSFCVLLMQETVYLSECREHQWGEWDDGRTLANRRVRWCKRCRQCDVMLPEMPQ